MKHFNQNCFSINRQCCKIHSQLVLSSNMSNSEDAVIPNVPAVLLFIPPAHRNLLCPEKPAD